MLGIEITYAHCIYLCVCACIELVEIREAVCSWSKGERDSCIFLASGGTGHYGGGGSVGGVEGLLFLCHSLFLCHWLEGELSSQVLKGG